MMRKNFAILGFFAIYVLPYPSYLPGHALYNVSRVADEIKRYWSWGNIASIKYHLSLSDKYLVEAKTLFEYKQYLLATDALARSDGQFQKLGAKDIRNLSSVVNDARDKHVEILEKLLQELPKEYLWTPEKSAPTQLFLSNDIRRAIRIRKETAV